MQVRKKIDEHIDKVVKDIKDRIKNTFAPGIGSKIGMFFIRNIAGKAVFNKDAAKEYIGKRYNRCK